jgi:Cu-Zn family superoxide dismutase
MLAMSLHTGEMHRMRNGTWGVALGLVLIGGAAAASRAQQPAPVKEIKVNLTNSQGQPAGTAVLKQKKSGVGLKVSLENMPFGEHGVHIHQNASCEAPDFKSAGPHFNPDGKQHGFQNPMGHHAGDTPGNISVGEDHRGEARWTLTAVTLQPGAPNSLLSNGGTSLIVHEHGDDMKTDPSGNSGNRIACGVIRQ